MNSDSWPPAGLDLNELQAAARQVAKSIKPVLEIQEGSKRMKQVGSSFILRMGTRAALVTAAHTVSGPTTKVIALDKGSATRWPGQYLVLEPLRAGIPDADVAYSFGEVRAEADDLMGGIPLDRMAVNAVFPEGASFMAIGYPASKAEYTAADQSLRNQLFFVSGHRAGDSAYAKHGLDLSVHLAVSYDPKSVRTMDGNLQQGPKPAGMSGGVLFAPMTLVRGAETSIVFFVAGILVEQRGSPHNLLIATRIDCLLDELAPGRPEPDRTHAARLTS
ncbi:MAG TPA: hypothetical protein VHB25_21890 [Gemmatimonadaceae bacterium]|nr:hypothetical protein [Gemmatimonadaceae bacterium]